MITVNSRKFDWAIRRTWQCELIEQRDSLLVLVGEFDIDVTHTDLGEIKKGTVSYEYYWLDRWYNIFRFHEPTGELRNFYCNINVPPVFEDDVLDYVDLDIDVLLKPDLSFVVLDREDYAKNAERYGYPDEVNEKVEETLKELLELIETRIVPGAPELFETLDSARRESR